MLTPADVLELVHSRKARSLNELIEFGTMEAASPMPDPDDGLIVALYFDGVRLPLLHVIGNGADTQGKCEGFGLL